MNTEALADCREPAALLTPSADDDEQRPARVA